MGIDLRNFRQLNGCMRWMILLLLCVAPQAAWSGTVEDIRARGLVACGVLDNSTWTGIATDLCKSLAAAVTGKAEAITMETLTSDDQFAALQAGDIDVLIAPRPYDFATEMSTGTLLVVPLLPETDGAVFGLTVRQGDDGWFATMRWTYEILRRGVPAKTSGGEELGLASDWQAKALAASGNLAEIGSRHGVTLK